MMFKVGEKVRCIRETGYLIDQVIYTVSKVAKDGGITVEECITPPGYETYKPSRFESSSYDVRISLSEYEMLYTAVDALQYFSDGNYESSDLEAFMHNISSQINNQ